MLRPISARPKQSTCYLFSSGVSGFTRHVRRNQHRVKLLKASQEGLDSRKALFSSLDAGFPKNSQPPTPKPSLRPVVLAYSCRTLLQAAAATQRTGKITLIARADNKNATSMATARKQA
jgi:hypothetical protein